MKTLTFTATVGGSVIVPATVKLENADASKGGITEIAEVIAPPGTNMVYNAVTEQYEYTFDETEFDGTKGYFWVKFTYDGEEYVIPKTISLLPLTGRYTSKEKLEKFFGVDSILRWSNISATGDTSANDVISERIAETESLIDEYLRGGVYTVPFTDPIPETICTIATLMAGVFLYEARGIEQFNEETGQSRHKLAYHHKRARNMLARVKTGAIELNLDHTATIFGAVNDKSSTDFSFPSA